MASRRDKQAPVSARQRIAEQQRAEQVRRKRTRMIMVGVAVVVALAMIIGAMLLANAARQREAAGEGSDAYVSGLSQVSAPQLDAVGVGAARDAATPVEGGEPVMVDGKPRVLYVGTEYCPYCGMERWALTIALSRFGTFDGLEASRTPANESSIPTVSYEHATFASDLIVFDGFETADAEGRPLQTLSADDDATLRQFNPGGSVPWTYWGTSHQLGASYDGGFLADANPDEVLARLGDANSSEAQGILGAANVHTARICALTGNQPGEVCDAPGVRAAAEFVG